MACLENRKVLETVLLEYSVRSWRREMYDRESSVLLGEEQCLVEESVVSLC